MAARQQLEDLDLENLPAELREQFPDVVEDLRNGVIDEVPDRVLDQLPANVVDRIPADFLANSVNVTLVIILAAIAGLCLLGFFYGVAKAAMKAAFVFLVVGGAAAVFLLIEL